MTDFDLHGEKLHEMQNYCQLVALFLEIWVAESNGDVRIFTGSSVSVHAHYKLGQNSPEQQARHRAVLKLNASQLPLFQVFFFTERSLSQTRSGRPSTVYHRQIGRGS